MQPELSDRVSKVMTYPAIVELLADERRAFIDALEEAENYTALASKYKMIICKAEEQERLAEAEIENGITKAELSRRIGRIMHYEPIVSQTYEERIAFLADFRAANSFGDMSPKYRAKIRQAEAAMATET